MYPVKCTQQNVPSKMYKEQDFLPELSTGSHAELFSESSTEVKEGELEQSVEHSWPCYQLLHFVQTYVLYFF